MARTVILSDSGKWVTLLRFEWEWGNGIFNNRAFSGFVGAFLQVGNPAVLVNQCIDATFSSQFLITVKRVARHAHDLAGF